LISNLGTRFPLRGVGCNTLCFFAQWWFVLMTLLTTPLTTLEYPKSTLGQTPCLKP
jgi:hypothetical protein